MHLRGKVGDVVPDSRDEYEHYDDGGNDDWSRELSAKERNELEVDGDVYSVQFEGDERLRIPTGTEWERVFAIRRYWSAWPTYRDAVLERFSEADKRAANFREQYPKKPPVAALKKFQQDEPNAWAVFASRQYFEIGGGPLGVEMFDFEGNLGPAHHREEKRFANASDDELRGIPPVRVVFGYADAENTQTDVFVIVAGEPNGTKLVDLRDRFTAARALGDLLETAQSADLAMLRETYRAFATSFWDWREKGTLDAPRFDLARLGSVLPMFVNVPMQTAIAAMLVDDTQWKRNAQKRPFFGNKSSVFVSVGDPTDSRMLSLEQQQASAEMVLKLDDEHAQTFAFLMASWLAQNDGQSVTQRARVHVNDLLDFRNLKRKKRDFKAEQKREERDRILRLNEMWMSVRESVSMRGKKRKTKEVDVVSRLIELAIETDATGVGSPIPLLLEGMPTSSIPYAFRYAPGEWAASYLGDSQFVGTVFRKILTYDTRNLRERMAMRIGLYLSFVQQRRARTVRELLVGAHIPIPKAMPQRSREAFEGALDRLQEDGIIASHAYVGGYPASDVKGWSKVWLDTVLVVSGRNALETT